MKDKGWIIILAVYTVILVSGCVLTLVTQLGERFHTSILDQMIAGDIPVLTIVGIGIILIPTGILLLALAISIPRHSKKEVEG